MPATLTGAAFDKLAPRYDELWTSSPVGRLQRDAVWRHIDPLFRPGHAVLDLGCGTGEDALHLMKKGIRVSAIDCSAAMVCVARERGVDAQTLAIEDLNRLNGPFNGAISNFGALNCIEDLRPVARGLARLINPGGYVALCTMGRLCLWETLYYALQPSRACRRWNRTGTPSTIGPRIFYPSVRRLGEAFIPGFRLIRWSGVGIGVPPSYVRGLSRTLLDRLAAFDRTTEQWPVMRALSDHRLLIFQRT